MQTIAPQSHAKRRRKRNVDTGRIDDDQWKVRQLLAKRNTARRGQTPSIEWLVDWDGSNPRTGKPWSMSWEREEDVSEDLKAAFEIERGVAHRSVGEGDQVTVPGK